MRTTILTVFGLLLGAGGALAQGHKLGEVNAEKPDGQVLQAIGTEADNARKLILLEQFVAQYPKHEATLWVYDQMQAGYIKAGQGDKALDIGEKILAADPEAVEAAHAGLKIAEEKKDAALIKKWAASTGQAAQKAAASPQPKDEDEVDAWKRRVDYARQVNTYSEYSLYAAALQQTDPAKRIDLIEELQRRNASSEYVPKAMPQLFLAYRQANQNDKAVALAEKLVAAGQSDEDMLLVLASSYVEQKKELDKVHAYSEKIVETMGSKPKPEGVADADWANRKNLFTGLAHFFSGSVYFDQNKFAQADKELRAALPLVQNNEQVKAEVLYRLAFSNYKMDKIQEAATFYRECSAIKSRFQALATKNLTAIRTQYRGVK